ncbi:uncharacterized protein JCM6883_004932 [Sporobolomyces salmoneus]|uniref:uncharacterized protein n=1 Tax=Sporobolomyces salmoneus TaxID=183962 RepID=UPI00317F275F
MLSVLVALISFALISSLFIYDRRMSRLLNLPGTTKDGYHALSEPVKSHTVSAGGIPQSIELGDLANDEFYDQVAQIRESIRQFDTNLTQLESKQIYSLQPQHDASTTETISVELNEMKTLLSVAGTELKKRITELGHQVGNDEARRGHWENLKAGLKRAVERQQTIEMAQRERVRERVSRQYRIVKPEATDEEVKQVLSNSTDPAGAPTQVFQQALSGSARTTAALAAFQAAKSEHVQFLQLEQSIIELSELIQQVAELVADQDPQIVKIEQQADDVRGDLENGVKEVQRAKLSATAARHKRKICAAIGLIMLTIVIVVIVVQFKGSGGGEGGGGSEPKKEEPAKPIEIPGII